MTDAVDELRDYLDRLREHGVERLVVRWIDETRPVEEGESGYTVRPVRRAVLTAKIDGEAEQRQFEGIEYEELRTTIDPYPFETLYRTDNVTRG